MSIKISTILHKIDLTMAAAKSVAVLLSYLAGFYLTGGFHCESRYWGAMLASIACVVTLQVDLKTSLRQGWLRVLGTFIGAIIATIYLLLFPFSITGFILTVFILEIICMILSIPDNGKMATMALIVIMLISQRTPDISPIVNSSLRFLETVLGAGIGIAIAWLVEVIKSKLT
ncbi:FUSC family protein [Bacteroides sp.]|uniref:FUSC family protein n=1 Tax=Bacteroides sp. TaxID=29523 RepID=UPI002FCBA842